jgi:hypothetical protein
LPLGSERGEIGCRDEGPGGFETGRETPRQAAAIEALGTVGGDLFEGIGEIRLDDQCGERRRLARGEKGGHALPIDQQGRAILGRKVTVSAGRGKAVAGKADCLFEKIAPGQAAELAMHHVEPGERARHRYRQRPDARDDAGIMFRRGRSRGGTAAVEDDGAARGPPIDLIEPVAAEPRHHRLDDG